MAPEHREALVLAEDDLLLGADDWAAALPGQTAEEASTTFAVTDGWPAALPIARALPGDAALHRHPLATALLGPLMPPPAVLRAAQRLAVAAVVTPSTVEVLGIDRADVDALYDGGWLWTHPHGWAFPEALRRVLCPLPDPAAARSAARTLDEAGDSAAALKTLAHAALWEPYLDLLATTARAGQGEPVLRAALRPLPERWRAAPAALYVAGLQARAAGDLPSAMALYTQALEGGLAAHHVPLAHNARGVVHAMHGDVEPALADFELAVRGGGRVAGEASQNRASLLVQLGRHAEAEASLQVATRVFREIGDVLREVRSLETLGSLHFGRGLLREAASTYRTALGLILPDRPPQAVLTHLNLAECHLWLGDDDRAAQHLDDAGGLNEIHRSATSAGWIARMRALVHLQEGAPAKALSLLDGVTTDDQSLRAEVALLRGRALRTLGQADAARAAIADASSLGVRADLESALLDAVGLDAMIDAARAATARLELVIALLRRARPEDLDEALQLISSQGYGAVLNSPAAVPLLTRADDPKTRALFPLRLHALGPLRVTLAGRTVQIADFPTRKSAALLVALALSKVPQNREQLADRFWPDAKNPLASLQTATYHLRSTFGVPVIGSERGLLHLVFPVRSDVGDLDAALQRNDFAALAALVQALPVPPVAVPELTHELDDERARIERLLQDALRAHAQARPALHVDRRDALRILIAVDSFDTDSREELIRWHEQHGELDLAEHERRRLKDALTELGVE